MSTPSPEVAPPSGAPAEWLVLCGEFRGAGKTALIVPSTGFTASFVGAFEVSRIIDGEPHKIQSSYDSLAGFLHFSMILTRFLTLLLLLTRSRARRRRTEVDS